jgi:hypothetical protein
MSGATVTASSGERVVALVGVRVVLVHAKDERAASFYNSYGFVSSPIDDLTLLLLVADLEP